jgi:hypothetical protein
MSLNSKAQQIADKHRLQQMEIEKKEIAKKKLQNNHLNSLNYNRDEYGLSYGHRNDSHLGTQARNNPYGKIGSKSPLGGPNSLQNS